MENFWIYCKIRKVLHEKQKFPILFNTFCVPHTVKQVQFCELFWDLLLKLDTQEYICNKNWIYQVYLHWTQMLERCLYQGVQRIRKIVLKMKNYLGKYVFKSSSHWAFIQTSW